MIVLVTIETVLLALIAAAFVVKEVKDRKKDTFSKKEMNELRQIVNIMTYMGNPQDEDKDETE